MRTLWTACWALLLVLPLAAQEKDVVLKVVAKKDKYAWDRDRGPKEFQAALADLLKQQKDGKLVNFPKPSQVDLVLQVTNVSSKELVIYVGGDANLYTFELKGPGVVTATPQRAFTLEFRLPNALTLAAGKSYEIPVKQLSDGFRGASRDLYWTAPGDYTLSATFQLVTKDGEKASLLKSDAVKLTVEEPKK